MNKVKSICGKKKLVVTWSIGADSFFENNLIVIIGETREPAQEIDSIFWNIIHMKTNYY